MLAITQNNEEAAREFEAAIEINPNIADLHLNLGVSYRALQQYAKAIDEFNRANALNPGDPLANTYIARTYLTVGDFPKAIQYASAAIKINPKDPYMYGNLGTMYYRNRQYKESLKPFQLAVRGGTTEEGVSVPGLPLDYGRVVEYYYFYGLAAARINQCGEALQISQLMLQGVPDDETAVFNAKEMVNICQQNINGTSTPTPTFIPGKANPHPQAMKESIRLSGKQMAFRQRRTSNSIVVLVLLMLVVGGGFLVRAAVFTGEIASPFKETAIPTRTSLSYAVEGETQFNAGALMECDRRLQESRPI